MGTLTPLHGVLPAPWQQGHLGCRAKNGPKRDQEQRPPHWSRRKRVRRGPGGKWGPVVVLKGSI